MTEIAGKVAVVTGGGSGIGRGLALALAAEGASVVVADIVKENAEAVASAINKTGARAIAAACDVSERASLRKLKSEANQAFGPVSLLFANAGVTMFKRLTDMSDDEVDWILQVDLFGVMNCMQAFIPDMIAARGGHVFATSSVSGLLPVQMTNHAPYVAAKAGVIGMMLTLRTELAEFGIGSTVLCPGPVKTQIADSMRYRPARFGGPGHDSVNMPRDLHKSEDLKSRSPEVVAQMVLRAVRKNRPMVITEAGMRDLFRQGYVDVVMSAFDDVVEFDNTNTDRAR